MKIQTKLLWLSLSLAGHALAQDPAFHSPNYTASSQMPLADNEMTVVFTYPNNPCGTLITSFSSPGSVSLGRGPVYELMLNKCQQQDFNSYPDDNSVRTYACQNTGSYEAILGEATFAFQCTRGQGDPQLVKIPLNRVPAY